MKIVIASSMYPPEVGRPATYIKELAIRLSKDNHITVVAYSNSKPHDNNFDLISISKLSPLFSRLIRFSFALWKASKNADLIYVQNAMSAGLPTAIISLFRKIPFVVTFIGDEAHERARQRYLTQESLENFLLHPEGGWQIRLMIIIQSFVLHQAKKIIASTTYLKLLVEKSYKLNGKKVVVLFPPLEKPEIMPFNLERKSHNIVAIVDIINTRNLEIINQFFKDIKETYKDAELAVLGEKSTDKNAEKFEAEMSSTDNIILVKKSSRTELWHLLEVASVCICKSSEQKTTNLILKSLAAGTPVITTETDTTREIIASEEVGLLLKSFDAPSLVVATGQVFKKADFYNKLRNSDSTFAKKAFSWESHLENLSITFKSIFLKPSNII